MMIYLDNMSTATNSPVAIGQRGGNFRTGDAETSLREAAAIFSAERATDGEAEAQVMLARALRAEKRFAARRGQVFACEPDSAFL